jgi:hypothetical protein
LAINELTGEETGLESLHPGHKLLSLTSEGDELFPPATRTKVLSNFFEGGTEALRGAVLQLLKRAPGIRAGKLNNHVPLAER